MQCEGVPPNPATFVGLLNACASVMALEEGRQAHQLITQSSCELDVFVGSSLIDMYAKCGSMEDASRMFNKMASHNVVTWTATLNGYAMMGCGKEALQHFERMCKEGVEVNEVTFICLLSACNHAGLVDEGLNYFSLMASGYNISVNQEHYACMVDIHGCSGLLGEAEDLIKTMPCEPNAAVWMALLGACRVHGDVEKAEQILKKVLELDPENAAGYVLLIQRLSGHDADYVQDTRFVLHDVDEEEKLFHLCHRSKKLAIAFHLIRTSPGTPLRTYNNLWVCYDCHTSTKFIAKTVRRTNIVRDANGFHHFEDGICSCRDYW
ncbi:unnamed protein product [Sphagnum troendelagicum]|uniref:DYW domain-containing protein n=1 Tax=Sphagnum troendelagicum TaxID=128251 RepID=A0ABP0TCK8_9BRYO